MASNHVPPNLRSGEFGIGQHILRPRFGYGFNCAVVFDPANDVLFAAMIQRMANPDNHSLQYRGHATVYQVLVDPSK